MNGLDLNLFQFDYDQTWAVLFFRPDGKTVLARYGTRDDKDGMKHNSLTGLQATMRRVLSVHKNWTPDMQPFYEKKLGKKAEFAKADNMPSATIRKIKEREANGKSSCIHCHNVYDAKRDVALDRGNYDPRSAFRYPLPTTIGLDADHLAKLQGDVPKALQAGAGESIHVVRMNGQNIHSLADMQFVLEQLPSSSGSVEVETVALDNASPSPEQLRKPTHRASIELSNGWRERGNLGWRASMYGMPPSPGLWVQAIDAEGKKSRGIAADDLALKVRGVFGQDVRKAGLKKNDVIVQFADETKHHAEGDFHAHLRLHYYKPNSKLPLRLLRGSEEVELTVVFKNN